MRDDGHLRLLIWTNSLRSVSRDQASGTESKIAAFWLRVSRTHNKENFIRFRWPCRSLWIWRGAIFDNFLTPVTLTLFLNLGENLSSCITHPFHTSFIEIRQKNIDVRTDEHCVRFYKVTFLRRRRKNGHFYSVDDFYIRQYDVWKFQWWIEKNLE